MWYNRLRKAGWCSVLCGPGQLDGSGESNVKRTEAAENRMKMAAIAQ